MPSKQHLRRVPLLAATILALSAVAGCASSGTPASTSGPGLDGETEAVRSQLNTLYEAAVQKGEDTVAVDTLNAAAFNQPNAKGYGQVVALFQKTFPKIRVVPVDVSTTPLTEKIAAEAKTGNHISDVALGGISDLYQLQGAGNLVEFAPANAANLSDPDNFRDPRGQAYEVSQGFVGLAYNTSKLTGDQVPKTLAQLAKPEWKGKFSLLGPGQSQVQEYLAQALYLQDIGVRRFDSDTFKAVTANAVITNNQTTYANGVASGKFSLNLFGPAVLDLTLHAQGQPIDFADSEATVPSSIWASVLKDAPHPNTARLFDAFLLSAGGQKTISSGTYFNPTIKGIPANPALASIKNPAQQLPFDKVVAYTERAVQLAPDLYPAGAAHAS